MLPIWDRSIWVVRVKCARSPLLPPRIMSRQTSAALPPASARLDPRARNWSSVSGSNNRVLEFGRVRAGPAGRRLGRLLLSPAFPLDRANSLLFARHTGALRRGIRGRRLMAEYWDIFGVVAGLSHRSARRRSPRADLSDTPTNPKYHNKISYLDASQRPLIHVSRPGVLRVQQQIARLKGGIAKGLSAAPPNPPVFAMDLRARGPRRSSRGTTRQDCLAAGLRREFAE